MEIFFVVVFSKHDQTMRRTQFDNEMAMESVEREVAIERAVVLEYVWLVPCMSPG